jgi:hypothetical protein
LPGIAPISGASPAGEIGYVHVAACTCARRYSLHSIHFSGAAQRNAGVRSSNLKT